MKAKLVGVRDLDFTASDGKRVKGVTLHLIFADEGVNGHATDKIFVRSEIELPKDLAVGKSLQVFFNRRGKVEAVVSATE